MSWIREAQDQNEEGGEVQQTKRSVRPNFLDLDSRSWLFLKKSFRKLNDSWFVSDFNFKAKKAKLYNYIVIITFTGKSSWPNLLNC